jgi:hypothetical protein|tara:strand:- start:2361 stop:2939 length:579 start_codon:yes stop_codon:yes gene_type:complete
MQKLDKKESKKVVVLSPETHIKLGNLCKAHGSNMKDFTEKMITYFEKTGIDPLDAEGTDLKEAIKGLRKENNRVIGFIKQQEKTKLDPILDELSASALDFRERSKSLDKVSELAMEIFKLRNAFEQDISRSRHAIGEGKREVYNTAVMVFSKYLQEQDALRKKSTFGGIQIKLDELDELNRSYKDYFKQLKH